jgi:hypothetical protein
MTDRKYLSKDDLNNITVHTPLKLTKKSIKLGMEIAGLIGVDFQRFLSSQGIGHQKYKRKEIEKAKVWGGFSVTEKEIIAKWIDISTEQKREIIKTEQGVISDYKIDEFVERFNKFSDFFEHMDLGKLEEISKELEELAEEFNGAEIMLKVGNLFMDQYNEETDTYGELFIKLVKLLSEATDVKEDILFETSIELLLELSVRLFLKTQKEVDESFFIKMAIDLLMKSFGSLITTKTGN